MALFVIPAQLHIPHVFQKQQSSPPADERILGERESDRVAVRGQVSKPLRVFKATQACNHISLHVWICPGA